MMVSVFGLLEVGTLRARPLACGAQATEAPEVSHRHSRGGFRTTVTA